MQIIYTYIYSNNIYSNNNMNERDRQKRVKAAKKKSSQSTCSFLSEATRSMTSPVTMPGTLGDKAHLRKIYIPFICHKVSFRCHNHLRHNFTGYYEIYSSHIRGIDLGFNACFYFNQRKMLRSHQWTRGRTCALV